MSNPWFKIAGGMFVVAFVFLIVALLVGSNVPQESTTSTYTTTTVVSSDLPSAVNVRILSWVFGVMALMLLIIGVVVIGADNYIRGGH